MEIPIKQVRACRAAGASGNVSAAPPCTQGAGHWAFKLKINLSWFKPHSSDFVNPSPTTSSLFFLARQTPPSSGQCVLVELVQVPIAPTCLSFHEKLLQAEEETLSSEEMCFLRNRLSKNKLKSASVSISGLKSLSSHILIYYKCFQCFFVLFCFITIIFFSEKM